MSTTESSPPPDHDVPTGAPSAPPPLVDVPAVRRRSAAEEARTLVASTSSATLGSLSEDGDPWASLVAFGALEDGAPVLCVSRLAEHGRNLARDQRASLMVAEPSTAEDRLATGRVTLAGVVQRADATTIDAARAALVVAVPYVANYVDFGDFTVWILRVARVRWVGGYGRMSSASAAAYAAAAPDPVGPAAAGAVAHMNSDHADALLAMATGLAGYTDATSAQCTALDRYGVDLIVETPRGRAPARVGFAAPITAADGLRAAAVELTRRARAVGA